jgi:hypothetical protein
MSKGIGTVQRFVRPHGRICPRYGSLVDIGLYRGHVQFLDGIILIEQPVQSAVGIGVVLMGAPAYWLWRRRAVKEAAR